MTVREYAVDEIITVRSAVDARDSEARVIRQHKQRITVQYLVSGRVSTVSATRIKAPKR